MLCSLFVYNVAHFKRRNSRGRAKMENNREKKDESISILIHRNVSFFYIFEIDAGGNYHSHKVYQRHSVDYATYWVLTVKVVAHTQYNSL